MRSSPGPCSDTTTHLRVYTLEPGVSLILGIKPYTRNMRVEFRDILDLVFFNIIDPSRVNPITMDRRTKACKLSYS